MTLEQAFEIIVTTTGAVSANREAHIKIQQALDVIKTLLDQVKQAEDNKLAKKSANNVESHQ